MSQVVVDFDDRTTCTTIVAAQMLKVCHDIMYVSVLRLWMLS